MEHALKLAETYQLVTPVSGAVVLETQEQYKQAGLEPVDPDTVPQVPVLSGKKSGDWIPGGGGIPEPATILLMGIGVTAWGICRKLFKHKKRG